MADKLTLAVSNRAKSGTIKKLPASIDITTSTTIEELQQKLAKASGVRDYNRIGIFDPVTRKIIRDRRAVLGAQENVVASKAILVQDLGAQVGWRTVYLIEYAGPLLFHGLLFYLRPIIPLPQALSRGQTASRSDPVTDIQRLVYILFQLHFVKRELETAFLHRFSANTMPARNIVRNSAFYWLLAGFACAWSLYAPLSPFRVSSQFPAASPPRSGFGSSPLDYVGIALYVFGQIANFSVHWHLAHLRSPGGTEKKIPNAFGSSLVTAPNYMFEILTWLGVILISRDIVVVIFISVGMLYMRMWSRDKERALRRLFPDKYKKKKYTMFPGLI
ncbi:enoyl reductase [Sporothrix brasiliensis 5110]|uniref:Enoyl reductase n=1 Tax=Sporothrix brasiliensis 5110 TaxID=1398154 RepID=A0A0C2EVY9_9PEZI|nr:enoyl reductase [Sporothrix brasiliensis 5110]KIH90729.1 enoyl reductase [Sporothrix brasiliensis 5110]